MRKQFVEGVKSVDHKGAQLGRRRLRKKSRPPVTMVNEDGVTVIRETSRAAGHSAHDQGCGIHNADRKPRRCKTRMGQKRRWQNESE